MRPLIALAMAGFTLSSMAQAPSPPPPAQPQPAAAGTASAGTVFSPNRAGLATAATGMVQPSGPGIPAGMPGGSMPSAVSAPAPAMPLPLAQGAQAQAATPDQEVPAMFVGRINGTSVYRATSGGYLFDKAKRPKVVPKETGAITDTAPTAQGSAKK